jgi:hypothetical protein
VVYKSRGKQPRNTPFFPFSLEICRTLWRCQCGEGGLYKEREDSFFGLWVGKFIWWWWVGLMNLSSASSPRLSFQGHTAPPPTFERFRNRLTTNHNHKPHKRTSNLWDIQTGTRVSSFRSTFPRSGKDSLEKATQQTQPPTYFSQPASSTSSNTPKIITLKFRRRR